MSNKVQLIQFLGSQGMTMSHAEGRRLLANGGVRVNGEVIKDPLITLEPGDRVQKGRDLIREVTE